MMGPGHDTSFVLFCLSVLVTAVAATDTASCPEGWRLFGQSCYRLTDSPLRHDQLTERCRQLGGAAVSIHSSDENNLVARVAGGKYVWIGMKVTGPRTLAWEDGSRYSYAKFLPPGNRMLKRKFVGAGIFQQSCRRWNYDRVSRLLHGVCKMPVQRCPSGSLERSDACYFLSNQPVPWWDAEMACFETDRLAAPAHLRQQDWQLNIAIASHFGGNTELLVHTEDPRSVETCSWTTVQYAQRKSHTCDFGCAELFKVLCKRPKGAAAGGDEPVELLRMMPPMYKEEELPVAPPASDCPSGWATRGKRCVSEPTQPSSRVLAEARCQQANSSRLATVRDDTSRTILALQLQGVSEAWVRDERPPAARYAGLQQLLLGGAAAALVQPGYSVLSAEGRLGSRSSDAILPGICERCQLPCGPGAVAFLGHCYRVLEEERTLTNASRSCAALGGALVSIESGAENRFVTALAFPASSPQCDQLKSEVWLGLRRAGVSFSWEWEDCSPVTATFWTPEAGSSGRCACLDRGGLWRDQARCEGLSMLAVCEWDPCQPAGRYGGACDQLQSGPAY